MLPFVTIAIPCLNEALHIEDCLGGVFAQTYPGDRFEVLVSDGGSTDGTLEILARLAAEEPRLQVLHNPDRIQAAAMNQMIRRAKGDVIVRMDVHCRYAPTYVAACIEALEASGADNVGGAQRAQALNRFQRALCAALTSPLGVGGAAYRSADNEGFVDTVFLGAFRRNVFETAGLYDPHAITNEDAELNQRIIDGGGRVFLSRSIEVYYTPRESFQKLAKQYFKYGQGRARTLLKQKKFLKLRPALPFLMVSCGAAVLVVPFAQVLAPLYFGTYGAATGLEAIRIALKSFGVGGLTLAPMIWAIFPVLHISHGTGFAAGLWRYARKPDWTETEYLPSR